MEYKSSNISQSTSSVIRNNEGYALSNINISNSENKNLNISIQLTSYFPVEDKEEIKKVIKEEINNILNQESFIFWKDLFTENTVVSDEENLEEVVEK